MSSSVALPEGVEHGSLRAYNHYKCRCVRCVEKRRTYDAEYQELRTSLRRVRREWDERRKNR